MRLELEEDDCMGEETGFRFCAHCLPERIPCGHPPLARRLLNVSVTTAPLEKVGDVPTGSEQHALRGVFTLLAEDRGEQEIRERLGWALLDLLHADQFASFVWDAARGGFGARVALHMDPANLDS